MTLYDTIGINYSLTRSADERIGNKLIELLNLSIPSRIVDVGAGTGNYTQYLADKGYELIAIEPSPEMRSQAKGHERVQWLGGVAEKLPLNDGVVDGAIVTLAFHHFPNQRQALTEINRVVGRGPIVIFTYDPLFLKMF
ncbi:MAG: methyltransferase domain-containing protein [Aphanothece sp. CMT-3BRIN-NPC111]|nr:methyltransferase domain-containing protein [Aphanothece sp. CMT-3BRIN-NPC111]